MASAEYAKNLLPIFKHWFYHYLQSKVGIHSINLIKKQ